jgi:hypothetical protein
MTRKKILGALCIATVALATMQYAGLLLYEVREVEWFFTPAHFAGGICVAFAALYVAHGFNVGLSAAHVLLFVLFIGIAWEFLEYGIGSRLTAVDTISDIIAGLLGGFVAYRIAGTSQ